MVRAECISKVLVVFLLMVTDFCKAFQYELVFDERLFMPCTEFPDNFLNKYLKYPENLTILPDDRLYICGDTTITYDFPPKKYPFVLEFFKKGRGAVWQKTVYGFKRPDLCTSIFDPTEIWHAYIKHLPAEQRVCPFFKDQIFSADVVTEQTFDFLSNSMEGDYLAHFEAGTRNNLDDVFLCAEAQFSFYRV